MEPLLKGNSTTVTLVKPALPIKKYNIALYRRDNGTVVLHRVIGKRREACESKIRRGERREYGGKYNFRGDSEYNTEKGVPFKSISAIAIMAETDGKTRKLTGLRHNIYGFLRVKTLILRRIIHALGKRTRKRSVEGEEWRVE